MCIICNCNFLGDEFLEQFQLAQLHMEKAREVMVACRDHVQDPEITKQYDAAHKHMVRVSRDWNMTEHIREKPIVIK